MHNLRRIITILLLTLITISSLFSPNIYANTQNSIEEYINNYYVDDVDSSVFEQSTEEIFESLDPYSTYFSENELDSFFNSIDQSFVGIGVSIENVEQGILIQTVFPNSPAEKSGIEIGDIITDVDGTSIVGFDTSKAISLIKGKENTKVELKLLRKGTRITKEVIRERIILPTVTGEKLAGDIGYLQILSFNDQTISEMNEAISQLTNVEHWILDVRNNPGGYLHAAQRLLGFFYGVEIAIMSEEKNGTIAYSVQNQPYKFKEPVDLLINEYSASASEIVAGALKDYNAATLYGTTTFGKGLMQKIYPLPEGGAVKLSTARFFTPQYNEIQDVGIKPNIETRTPLSDSHYHALQDLNKVYRTLSPMNQVNPNKVFNINLNMPANINSLREKVDLIELGGNKVNFELTHNNDTTYQLKPISPLISGSDYAIMIHPGWQNTETVQSEIGIIMHISVK